MGYGLITSLPMVREFNGLALLAKVDGGRRVYMFFDVLQNRMSGLPHQARPRLVGKPKRSDCFEEKDIFSGR